MEKIIKKILKSPCFIIIYKDKGKYRIYYKHTKEEKKEIKSIILGTLENGKN